MPTPPLPQIPPVSPQEILPRAVLPVVPSIHVLPDFVSVADCGEKTIINDIDLFCKYFYTPTELHEDHQTLEQGPPPVITPTDQILHQFVHMDRPVQPIFNPELPYMSIITLRRAQKIRQYIKKRLEDEFVGRNRVGRNRLDQAAVAETIGLCEFQMVCLARDEDLLLSTYKTADKEDFNKKLDKYLEVMEEGWFRLAGVPKGRAVLGNVLGRATLPDQNGNIIWQTWDHTDTLQ